MTHPVPQKIALAVQGSFGHIYYATGILDAFRQYNHEAQASGKPIIQIESGSGCVEMLTPLYFYLADQAGQGSMLTQLQIECAELPLLAQQSLLASAVRTDAWQNYYSGLQEAQSQFTHTFAKWMADKCEWPLLKETFNRMLHSTQTSSYRERSSHAAHTANWEELLLYWSGLPGVFAFNPLFMAATQGGLNLRYSDYAGPPIFSNATRASDLEERYLYYGRDPSPSEKNAMSGTTRKRKLLKMTPEYFFASGARLPYIAPMPVNVDGQLEYWMEGAMRCNPPLTPLIDTGATHIVLLRFFGKDNEELHRNSAQSNERYMDVMFSIPLQKELESIRLNNHLADCLSHLPANVGLPPSLKQRRHVNVLDPADRTNGAYLKEYEDFLIYDLNGFSHYCTGNVLLQNEMFECGQQIGRVLVPHLLNLLNGGATPYPHERADMAGVK